MRALGVVGFTVVRDWGRWVHSGWLGSPVRALGVFGFIRGCWVQSRVHWCSMGSSRVFWFARTRPRGGCVHPETLASFARALGVVWFIWGRWVNFRSPLGLLRISGVVGFSCMHSGDHWVYSCSLG